LQNSERHVETTSNKEHMGCGMITVKQHLQPNACIVVFTPTVTENRQAPMKVTSMQAKQRACQLLLQALGAHPPSKTAQTDGMTIMQPYGPMHMPP